MARESRAWRSRQPTAVAEGSTRLGALAGIQQLLLGHHQPSAPLPLCSRLPFRARCAATSERRRGCLVPTLHRVRRGAACCVELVLEVFFPSSLPRPFTPGILAAVAYPFLASIPLTTAYAVMVERVVEVSFVYRRTLQYALAKTAILALDSRAARRFSPSSGSRTAHLTIGELIALPAGRLTSSRLALTGVVSVAGARPSSRT